MARRASSSSPPGSTWASTRSSTSPSRHRATRHTPARACCEAPSQPDRWVVGSALLARSAAAEDDRDPPLRHRFAVPKTPGRRAVSRRESTRGAVWRCPGPGPPTTRAWGRVATIEGQVSDGADTCRAPARSGPAWHPRPGRWTPSQVPVRWKGNPVRVQDLPQPFPLDHDRVDGVARLRHGKGAAADCDVAAARCCALAKSRW